jgi:hypothetical protein
MFGVIEHGAQQAIDRDGKSVAQSRRNGENLIGFGSTASAAHAESFIQIYAEHGVCDFEPLSVIDVKVGFIAL